MIEIVICRASNLLQYPIVLEVHVVPSMLSVRVCRFFARGKFDGVTIVTREKKFDPVPGARDSLAFAHSRWICTLAYSATPCWIPRHAPQRRGYKYGLQRHLATFRVAESRQLAEYGKIRWWLPCVWSMFTSQLHPDVDVSLGEHLAVHNDVTPRGILCLARSPLLSPKLR
jgi:hypothetical protein